MLSHVDKVCSRGNLGDDDADMNEIKQLLSRSFDLQYKLIKHMHKFQSTVDLHCNYDL